MKLVGLTVRDYRSITKANKLPIQQSTILVGPNNEGKSNILRALVTGLSVLKEMGRPRPSHATKTKKFRFPGFYFRKHYNWERDYPVQKQKSNPDGESIIRLEFKLTPVEITIFKRSIKSDINGTLPIELAFSNSNVKCTVTKKGPGGASLTSKSSQIALFISRRLDFQYIPAVRTAERAQKVVSEILDRELAEVERNSDYKEALKKIAELQQPTLDKIAAGLKATLVQFLPNIKSVRLTIPPEDKSRALRSSCRILINDGAETNLLYKGDGVQSLAALGVMQHAAERQTKAGTKILAIEEPESHLHPHAIHEFREVLAKLSKTYQIVLTTHNPLFVDRLNPKSNILVERKRAKSAQSIDEIRDILGVRAADNLQNAKLVLVVEGEDDKIAMKALLSHYSTQIANALQQNTIAIDTLGGGTNLAYKLGLLHNALCSYYCFLDNDDAGRTGTQKAQTEGLLSESEFKYATCPRRPDSELEDLYNPTFYKSMILNKYGINLDCKVFRSNKKWTPRIKAAFCEQGKPFNKKLGQKVKTDISELITKNPGQVLHEKTRGAFDALVTVIEEKLQSL